MFTKHRWNVLNIQWHPVDDHPAITNTLTGCLPLMWPKFNSVCVFTQTQTPTAENKKCLQIQVRFFTNSLLRLQVRKKNTGSCRSRLRHSRSVATSGVDPSGTLKNWVIGFVLAITARSASALANAFFARTTLMCTLRHSQLNASKPTVDPPLSWLPWKKEKNLHVKLTLLTKLISSSYKLALLIHLDMCLVQR